MYRKLEMLAFLQIRPIIDKGLTPFFPFLQIRAFTDKGPRIFTDRDFYT